MGNVNSGQGPLISPDALFGKKPIGSPPTQGQPAANNGLPQLPSLPQLPNQYTQPPIAQDTVKLPALPGGVSMPQVSLNPPPQTMQGKVQELSRLLRDSDQMLLGHVTGNQLQIQKNAQGQITGFLVNGRPANQQEVQQMLLPMSSQLHQQLEGLKQVMQDTFMSLQSEAQVAMPQMTPQEQNATRIQLQAVQVLYNGFQARINQVDSLIR